MLGRQAVHPHSNITDLQQCSKAIAVEFKPSLLTSGISNIAINKLIGKLFNRFDYIQAYYEHQNIFDGLKIKGAKQETKREAYSKEEAKEQTKFFGKKKHYSHMTFIYFLLVVVLMS